jgi:hypothetical protein
MREPPIAGVDVGRPPGSPAKAAGPPSRLGRSLSSSGGSIFESLTPGVDGHPGAHVDRSPCLGWRGRPDALALPAGINGLAIASDWTMPLLWQQRQDIGPALRVAAATAYIEATGRTLLWGGVGEQEFNDTWEWDGEGWVQVADTGPTPTQFAGMAYDSDRNVAVVFIGTVGPSSVSETWEWDGEAWTQVEDTGPQARNGLFQMAYDGARQVTILEGGQADPGGTLDPAPVGTWAWDGTTWTQVADVGPHQRLASALAYDASRQRVVLFGGVPTDGTTPQRDTWEWDGSAWEQISNMGPATRFGHAMTGTTDATLLFGGVGVPQKFLQDTWTWDGELWRQRQDMGPSPRFLPALSWDAARARLVLFGGRTLTEALGDTWESFERP